MSKATVLLEKTQAKIFKLTAELKTLKDAEKNIKATVKAEIKAGSKKIKG